jgi:hypothetical protein
VEGSCEDGNEPFGFHKVLGSSKFLSGCAIGSFSGRAQLRK